MCAEFLKRLTEAEQQHGIPFDRDVDALLCACLAEGRAGSSLTLEPETQQSVLYQHACHFHRDLHACHVHRDLHAEFLQRLTEAEQQHSILFDRDVDLPASLSQPESDAVVDLKNDPELCAEFLKRLAEAEKQHGIPFDRDVDAFLRACLAEGRAGSPLTHFYLRLLGLEASTGSGLLSLLQGLALFLLSSTCVSSALRQVWGSGHWSQDLGIKCWWQHRLCSLQEAEGCLHAGVPVNLCGQQPDQGHLWCAPCP